MPTSSVSINHLAAESLAHIFAALPPDERVRLERVCRHWRATARKFAWTEFRTLTLDTKEWAGHRQKAFDKYRALFFRGGRHLRELSFPAAIREYSAEQFWTMLPNLRHLHFDACVSSETLRVAAVNLKRLQTVHFSVIDWRGVAGLHDLLRINNASLQALRLPSRDDLGNSFGLPALPSSLRALHITTLQESLMVFEVREVGQIDELLELAATCCPQLAMLMLPLRIGLGAGSLARLSQFENLSYLCLTFDPSHAPLFTDSLAKIGARLKALLLEQVDSRVLHLIAEYCPLLEHFYFDLKWYDNDTAEGLLSGLQSLFQLSHLRSLSISNIYERYLAGSQILDVLSGLKAKGNIEYLHLPWGLLLPVKFIINLIQLNLKLHKLTCTIRCGHTPAQLEELKALLEEMEGPLELELIGHCPPALKVGENSGRVRVRADPAPVRISQPMLRQLWAQALDASLPDLIDLDD